MLDSPPIDLGRGDRHAQADWIAFPRYDEGIQAAVAGGELLDSAGDELRGAGCAELKEFSVHKKLWYTHLVIGPPANPNLAPPSGTVKHSTPSRGRHSQLIQPIKKTRIAEEVADRIRMLVLDGTFPPGQPLPSERLLTERFGVSRGSIRDALRMLEMIGLLETRHGRGTFPRELTVDRLVAPLASVMTYRQDLRDELMDVRRMFEPAVARAAATRATEQDFADLQRILEAQRQKLKSGRSAIVEDTAFHSALARATHNRVIVSIMATLNDLLVESRALALKQKGRPERSIEGHEAVVAALRDRDAEAAARAMHEHIERIADLQSLAQKVPGNAVE